MQASRRHAHLIPVGGVPRKLSPVRLRAGAKSGFFIAVLAVVLVLPARRAFGERAVERHGPLRVEGNRIVGQHGQPVVLRGMSFFWSQWMGRFYNTHTVAWLRDDWHCTVVRAALGVENGGYLAHSGREMEKVETIVRAAIDLGIFVIVDWHDHHADQHLPQAKLFSK